MTEYRRATNQIHQVKLTSRLVHALWISREVCAGEKAAFEVWTHFVANGAAIQVTATDKKGNPAGTCNGQVFGNFFGGSLAVPEKAQDALTFTAKLPDHNLEKKSDACRVLPPVKIKNQKWDRQEARRGDIVKLTADVENIPDGLEVLIQIYEHDRDGAHDLVTRFPCRVENRKLACEWIYEYHEDTDEIPTDEELKAHGKRYNPPEYFWVAEYGRKRFGEKQESGLLLFKDWIEISLADVNGKPVADAAYTLRLPDGSQRSGRLDKNGLAKVKDVPPGGYHVEFPNYGR